MFETALRARIAVDADETIESFGADTGQQGEHLVARALRNHNVWLVVTYVGLMLLMARTYA